MLNNNGALLSDLDGEELVMPSQSQAGVTPPSNEAQIDHIVPKNPADPNVAPGTNSYSNAQVLSRLQNAQKSNK
jgi:filamentous hemagglutinin